MPYAIRCTPHYYANDIFGRDKEHLVAGGPPFGDEVSIVLGTEEEAQTLARLLNSGSSRGRYLDQNQYARPEYAVVPYRGKVSPRDLSAAMWALGYGCGEDGELLGGAALQERFDRLIKESAA
jgi:hypothetical protein